MKPPVIPTVRASSMPQAMACPASVRDVDLSIDNHNPAGEIGTAIHDCLAYYVERGASGWSDYVAKVIVDGGFDSNDVWPLVAIGRRIWDGILAPIHKGLSVLTEADCRFDTERLSVTGHIDVLGIGSNVVRVTDWKSGRKDTDHRAQIKSYLAAAIMDADVDEGYGHTIWLRDDDYETLHMTRDGADAWAEEAGRRIGGWIPGTFYTGEHCNHCKRSTSCPALRELVRRDVSFFVDHPEQAGELLVNLTPDEFVALWDRWRRVEHFGKSLEKAMRQRLVDGGPVEGQAKRLEVIEQGRREVLPLKAWPVLGAFLEDEEIAQAVKVSITKAESLVASKAPRGQGAKTRRAFKAALDDAGAIENKTITKVKQTLIKKEE